MTKDKISPLPWNVMKSSEEAPDILIRDKCCVPVAVSIPLSKKNKANAQYIVKAVNNHDKLVEVLKDVLEDLKLRAEIDEDGYKVLDISNGVLYKAQQLLNEIEEG